MIKKPTTLIALILMLILSVCILAYAYANRASSANTCCAENMQDCHQNKEMMPGQMLWETVSAQFSF